MTIYKLDFVNFEGDYTFELYYSYQKARARFNELWDNYKNFSEFEGNRRGIECFLSYFDPNYNAGSTYISLEKITLESLFFD